MRYTHLHGWRGYANGTGAEYDMPIIGHQELYNRLPAPGSANIKIAEGAEGGYLDATALINPICTTLDFNPFKVSTYLINDRGLAYDLIPDVIHNFMGEYTTCNDNGYYIYPTYSGTNFGPMNYATGYSVTQAGAGTTSYGSADKDIPFYNCMQSATKFISNDALQYTFEIWPQTAIERGYIDTQHFQTDEGRIRCGQIIITIWVTSEGRYNFDIYLRSFNYYSSDSDTNVLALNGAKTGHVYNPSNPLNNDGEDGDEGGNGDYDNDDDTVGIPDLPSLDITALGGFNLYKLEPTAFAQLMNFLNTTEPGANMLKWFTNPIQAIAAAYILPYPVKGTSPSTVSLLGLPTTISCAKCSPWNQWNLGTVYIKQGFGDCFLDYSPYSRVSMYLPFIGVRQLTADDIIGHNVNVTYQFDNISGACIAYISSDDNVRYTFAGSCAVGIPISQSNWGQTYIAAATAAAGAIMGGISAGLGASGSGAGTIIGSTVRGAVEGSGGLNAFNAKPTISRSGSICGASSAIGINKPYLIIEKPDKAKIDDPKSVIGITSGRVLSLGSLSGFNALENFHLDHIPATGEELDEIERLLHEGVIF